MLVRTIALFELTFLTAGPDSQTLVVALYYAVFAAGVRAPQSVDAMAMIYMVVTLIWLLIALRFVNPTQLVSRVKEHPQPAVRRREPTVRRRLSDSTRWRRVALRCQRSTATPCSRRSVDRDAGIGIVHLGIGAFHRAHQAIYTDDALALERGDWGICGVSLRSADVRDRWRRRTASTPRSKRVRRACVGASSAACAKSCSSAISATAVARAPGSPRRRGSSR